MADDRRVKPRRTAAYWFLSCKQCDQHLLKRKLPIDITLWMHTLQEHTCHLLWVPEHHRLAHHKECQLPHVVVVYPEPEET